MAFYGSTEWLNNLQDTLNSDSNYQKASSNFNASMLITTDMKGLPKPIYVWMDIRDGGLRQWEYVAEPSERKSDYTLTGDYFVWKAICKGELEVLKAVVTGKLKLKGNKLKLLRQTKSSFALLNVMKGLKTEFPDDVFMGKS